jgi:Mg-chelatase subunit ChlD
MQEHNKMSAARTGALDVFNTKINDSDKIGVIGFHSITEVLLTPVEKGANYDKIRSLLQNLDFTPYQTAFYDALGQGIDSLKNTPEDRQKWLVSLTDGMDNSSQRFNANSLAEYIKSLGYQLHIIIIGVGPELKQVSSQIITVVNATQQGKYIPIYSTQNVTQRIQEAFKQVKEIMAASEIEGFTPEAK